MRAGGAGAGAGAGCAGAGCTEVEGAYRHGVNLVDHHEERLVGEERADVLKQRHLLHHVVAALFADVEEIQHGRVQVRQRRDTLRHVRAI